MFHVFVHRAPFLLRWVFLKFKSSLIQILGETLVFKITFQGYIEFYLEQQIKLQRGYPWAYEHHSGTF